MSISKITEIGSLIMVWLPVMAGYTMAKVANNLSMCKIDRPF